MEPEDINHIGEIKPIGWRKRQIQAQEDDDIQDYKKPWVSLTDEEIDEWTPEIHVVIRAIEAKLKEKNT